MLAVQPQNEMKGQRVKSNLMVTKFMQYRKGASGADYTGKAFGLYSA